MTMPLLKGLVGPVEGIDDAEPTDESAIPMSIDDLTNDELEGLQMAADEALASGALDAIPMPDDDAGETVEGEETAADEAAETPAEQEAEADAGTEMHSTTEWIEQAKACAEECTLLHDQLQEAVDALEDATPAEDLVEQASEAVDSLDDIVGEAEAAADDDDIHTAADAAARVDVIKEQLTAAIESVAALQAAEDAPEPEEVEEPATPATAPAAKPAKAEPPLAMWASKTRASMPGKR